MQWRLGYLTSAHGNTNASARPTRGSACPRHVGTLSIAETPDWMEQGDVATKAVPAVEIEMKVECSGWESKSPSRMDEVLLAG